MSEKVTLSTDEYIKNKLSEVLKEDMDHIEEIHMTPDEMLTWILGDH